MPERISRLPFIGIQPLAQDRKTTAYRSRAAHRAVNDQKMGRRAPKSQSQVRNLDGCRQRGKMAPSASHVEAVPKSRPGKGKERQTARVRIQHS